MTAFRKRPGHSSLNRQRSLSPSGCVRLLHSRCQRLAFDKFATGKAARALLAPASMSLSLHRLVIEQDRGCLPLRGKGGRGLLAAPRLATCSGLMFGDMIHVGWSQKPLVRKGDQSRLQIKRQAGKHGQESHGEGELQGNLRARALRERHNELREGKLKLRQGWEGGKAAQVNVHMDDGRKLVWSFNRRDALRQLMLGVMIGNGASYGWLRPNAANAALLQFPATDLRNTYYLVRAGEGESEAGDYVLTNPVAKTSMSSGLSPQGRSQVVKETLETLKSMGACSEGCWLWPSITQRSYQTAELLSSLLGVSRSRIVPEYSFLDSRGLGALEGLRVEAALHQVQEGDSFSPDWRPLRGYDGTPNESVADVLVRVRQVLSITETQYSGSDIIIISPDSDNLSVLQAALLGTDLRRHHDFSFRPGEVRAVQLSMEPGDYSPRSFSCPRPPRCD